MSTPRLSDSRHTMWNDTEIASFMSSVDNATKRAVHNTQTAYEQAAARNMETTLAIGKTQSPGLGSY